MHFHGSCKGPQINLLNSQRYAFSMTFPKSAGKHDTYRAGGPPLRPQVLSAQVVHDCMRAYNSVAALLPLLPVAPTTAAGRGASAAGVPEPAPAGVPTAEGASPSGVGSVGVAGDAGEGLAAELGLRLRLPSMLALDFMVTQPTVHDVPFPPHGAPPSFSTQKYPPHPPAVRQEIALAHSCFCHTLSEL